MYDGSTVGFGRFRLESHSNSTYYYLLIINSLGPYNCGSEKKVVTLHDFFKD